MLPLIMNPVLNLLPGRMFFGVTKTSFSFAKAFCATVLLSTLTLQSSRAAGNGGRLGRQQFRPEQRSRRFDQHHRRRRRHDSQSGLEKRRHRGRLGRQHLRGNQSARQFDERRGHCRRRRVQPGAAKATAAWSAGASLPRVPAGLTNACGAIAAASTNVDGADQRWQCGFLGRRAAATRSGDQCGGDFRRQYAQSGAERRWHRGRLGRQHLGTNQRSRRPDQRGGAGCGRISQPGAARATAPWSPGATTPGDKAPCPPACPTSWRSRRVLITAWR